jgi:hypothetical protein
MQPNLFLSVVLAVAAGFALGALAYFLVRLLSRVTRHPALGRLVPSLLALALCVALFPLARPFRALLERLAYQHDLNKLVILGLMAAALGIGFRISILILRGDRRPG